MKPISILITILFILFGYTFAFAEISIKAQIDKTNITTDDNITYKVTIVSSEKNIPAPKLPEFKGFYLVTQAQSSSISFAKGNINASLVYTYILAPKEAGKFEIGPSTIKFKSKSYSSQTFEIEVKQGKAKLPAPPEQEPFQAESEEPQITL